MGIHRDMVVKISNDKDNTVRDIVEFDKNGLLTAQVLPENHEHFKFSGRYVL